MSSDFGTHKTAKARFWPWLEPFSDKSLQILSIISLLAPERAWEMVWERHRVDFEGVGRGDARAQLLRHLHVRGIE